MTEDPSSRVHEKAQNGVVSSLLDGTLLWPWQQLLHPKHLSSGCRSQVTLQVPRSYLLSSPLYASRNWGQFVLARVQPEVKNQNRMHADKEGCCLILICVALGGGEASLKSVGQPFRRKRMELVSMGKSWQNSFFFMEKPEPFFLIRFSTDRTTCFLKPSPLHKAN